MAPHANASLAHIHSWEIEKAVGYIRPMLNKLKDIHTISLTSQILASQSTKLNPVQEGDEWVLTEQQLPEFIDSTSWSLGKCCIHNDRADVHSILDEFRSHDQLGRIYSRKSTSTGAN